MSESFWPIVRGGSWGNGAGWCRSAYRGAWHRVFRGSYLGFRIVRRRKL